MKNEPHYLKKNIAGNVGTAHVKKGMPFLFIDDNEGTSMVEVEEIKKKYPGVNTWQAGDNPELANEFAEPVRKRVRTAPCRSFTSCQQEESAPRIESCSTILDDQNVSVCMIRLISMQLVRFYDVTEASARKESEDDLSPEYWKKEHQRLFSSEGHFPEDMELTAEEFEVVEVL